MIFATEDDPRVVDEQFVDLFPAFGLKLTSNSGAFWGDGDLRPEASQVDRMVFAVESKTRWSDKYKHCRPYAGEYAKAMKQLRKFDSSAIRMFLVYNGNTSEWAVSIPIEDYEALEEAFPEADIADRELDFVSRRGRRLNFAHLGEVEFMNFYEELEPYISDNA